jgi:hypothetical protein
MWLNLLMDDRQCDNITKLKEKKKKRATDWELSYRNNFFNHCASEKILPQILSSREKQPRQDGPGHRTGTPERDRGRVGSTAGLATY